MIASTLKQFAVQLSDTRLFETVVKQMERRNRRQSLLRVLMYHRIAHRCDDDDYNPGLISTTPEQFAAQMEFVARHYHVCRMSEVVDAIHGRGKLPDNALLLTFDDATTDFATSAWPVMKSLGQSATVFVPTAYPDQHSHHFWWDRLYRAVLRSAPGTTIPCPEFGTVTLNSHSYREQTFRRLKEYLKSIPHAEFLQTLNKITDAANVPDPEHNNVLGWNELRRLQLDGVTLAPHTHTHPMLNQLPPSMIVDEVRTSCSVLQEQIGHISRTLAYPAGGVSEEVVATMAAEGIELAFSTQRGVNNQCFQQPHRLRRINVGARTTLGLLRSQLANWGR